MTYPLTFAPSLLRERTGAWSLGGQTVGPGQTQAGAFPLYVMDGGGAWRCDYGDITLNEKDHILAWRAIEALADGGATPLIVPMCDKRFLPGTNGVYSYAQTPHSDDALFSDGTGYDQPVVVARAAADAAQGATELVIHFINGGSLRSGEHFSIHHGNFLYWRLYRIGGVTLSDAGDSVVTIRPPLRGPVPAGADIEFDQPRCVMRLADPAAMRLAIDLRRFAKPSVSFVETFLR